jgi:hypothetical protein
MAYGPPEPPAPPAPPAPPVPPTPQNTLWAQQINADAAAGLLTNANVQAAANGQQVPTFTDPAQILNAIKAGVMPDSYLPIAEQQVASAGLPVTTSATPAVPTDQTKTPAMRMASSPSASSGALPTTPQYTSYTPQQIIDYFAQNPGANVALAEQQFNADPAAVNAALAASAPPANNPLAQIVQNEKSAPTPTPTPTPASTPTPAPTQYGAFLTSNPGGIGTSYGQASSDLISQAQKENPVLATALLNGTAQYNADDLGNGYLVDTSTGQPIGGNYIVSSTPSGQTAINIPTSSGAMLQAIAGTASNGNGMLSPVSANNVFNVGLNRSTGGWGGGVTDFMSAAGPVISAVFPAAAPYVLAYNSASAANKGKYGVALIDALGAAGTYGAQNPNTATGQLVKQITDAVSSYLPTTDTTGATTNAPTSGPTLSPNSAPTGGVGSTVSSSAFDSPTLPNIQNANTNFDVATNNLTNLSHDFTSTDINPSGYNPGLTGTPVGTTPNSGTGFNVSVGAGVPSATNPLFVTNLANFSTGLVNGIGMQPPGSTNLDSMNGAYGIKIPTSTGTAVTPNAVLNAAGPTVIGTGGLPVTTTVNATGNTTTTGKLGDVVANSTVGSVLPSPLITTTNGNVVGTPAGQNTSTGILPKAATALTAAEVAAAAKAAAALTGSSPSSTGAISSGTTGGSSSGPWNSPLTTGAVVLGSSKFPGFTDPLAGLMGNITPSSSGSTGLIDNIISREYAGELGGVTQGYAKGGKVEEHLSKLEPEYVKVIKDRMTPDHHHPNYNGIALFRTGGLGKHVQGPGTGQSDDIPAMLADGEYVFDADTVSALGDGSNKAGASVLDKMRESIRKHKRSAPIDKIPPKAKSPLEYLKGKS